MGPLTIINEESIAGLSPGKASSPSKDQNITQMFSNHDDSIIHLEDVDDQHLINDDEANDPAGSRKMKLRTFSASPIHQNTNQSPEFAFSDDRPPVLSNDDGEVMQLHHEESPEAIEAKSPESLSNSRPSLG